VPELPAIAGVRLAHRRGGVRYPGRTDVRWRCSSGTPPPACSPNRMPIGAGGMVPRSISSRQSKGGLAARAGGQSGNAMPSPARATGMPAIHRQVAARAIGCKPADSLSRPTGVIGASLEAEAFNGVMTTGGGARAGDFLSAAKAIMTTGPFPKWVRAGPHRQGDRLYSRHRQGRRHDRADMRPCFVSSSPMRDCSAGAWQRLKENVTGTYNA